MRGKGLRLGDYWPVLAFAALLLIDVLLKHRFTLFDLRNMSVNVLPLALIALGQFFVVLTRGIDLSLGPIASVAGAIAALLLTNGAVPGFGVALGVGLAAGAANGFLVAGLRLPPIIATLATMSIWQGVALVILPDPGGDIPEGFQEALAGGSDILPIPLVLLIGAWLVSAWIMTTRFGLHLRAIGDDETAARMSGIRTTWVKAIAYTLGGGLAALGGIYLTVATSSGSPTIGNDFILTSIAAVVVGGVPLLGGSGTPLGVVMGALILTIVGSLLYFADISSFYQSIIDGGILLAVVGAGVLRERIWTKGGNRK